LDETADDAAKKAGAASTNGPVRIDQSRSSRNHDRAMSGRPPMTSRVHVSLSRPREKHLLKSPHSVPALTPGARDIFFGEAQRDRSSFVPQETGLPEIGLGRK
jgi:hypothetical protein